MPNYFIRKIDHHFLMPQRPLERLARFVEDACRGVERHDFRRGCLVGNLGQEVGNLDEKLRLRLEAILEVESHLAACLHQQAQRR